MHASWTELRPTLCAPAAQTAFVAHARALARASNSADSATAFEELREAFVDSVASSTRADRQALLAAGLVLVDLAMQRWQLRVRGNCVEVRPPEELGDDRDAEKARIRRQELVKRDAQLRQASVQKFIRSMERTRVAQGKFVSVFSLMRDGRELSDALRKARTEGRDDNFAERLAGIIDPYIQFVSSDDATCSQTGLRLMDVWRYFRHTWTNQYTSVPGRGMMFLVRDRAAQFHPIVGIGALSSPVMQIRERDLWIGWHHEAFLERVRTQPTAVLAEWLVRVVDTAISELYVDDLLEDAVISANDLTNPNEALFERLLQESADQRRLHHRFVRSRDHKARRSDVTSSEHWVAKARMHLFRSKRCLALASYLRARSALKEAFNGPPTAEGLTRLASTGRGEDAIRKILKKAKADRVGIAVADLSVCGAVQPYNAILGGKLVAMLAASPEVVIAYQRRYSSAESEIASAMAGRPIIREPMLALIGTTSLYGLGSSQYNRVSIPCQHIGGNHGDTIRYEDLGHSRSFGTSQYSDETIDALVDLVQQSENGQRVNSIFGEGISPKLRKVREGLNVLGLPADLLLRHYRRRVVYAVSLVRNLRDHLLGIETTPDYFVPLHDAAASTVAIAGWWRERWLRKRIASDEVLADVAHHTLVRPIRHGARVLVPSAPDRQLVFAEHS